MKKLFTNFQPFSRLIWNYFIVFFSAFHTLVVSASNFSASEFSVSDVCCMHPIMLFPHELKDEFQGHEKCVDDDKYGKESKRNQVNAVNNITSARAKILL